VAWAIGLVSVPPRLFAEQPISVAMHVHGSFSEGKGSMEWHTVRARSAGVDAIWWTDHDWRIEHWNCTRRSSFEKATWDEALATITEPDAAYPGETTSWTVLPRLREGSVALVTGLAREGKRSLRLTADDDRNRPAFRQFYLSLDTSRRQNQISLASRPRLAFSVHPDLFDPARDKFVLDIRLSEHSSDRPALRYVAGSLDEEDFDVVALPIAPGRWNDYEVDVARDAILRFSAGGADTLRALDNALVDVRIGVETRLGGTASVHFDEFRIEPDAALSGNDLFATQREIAAFWETEYPGVRQFVGTEISRYTTQPHVIAYGPDTRLPDYGEHDEKEPLAWAVEQAHARGSVVAYAHPFGAPVFAVDDTEEARLRRIRNTTIKLVEARLLGCDVFEVGYRLRGGGSLEEHLGAWDAVVANGIFVTGNGVNDSHGPREFDGWPSVDTIERMNNFVTWLWTDTVSEAALMQALRGGRAFFGDPLAFSGSLDLRTTEGFPMGRIVVTDRTSHEVDVRIDGVAPDDVVRLVQVEIRETDPPGWTEPNVLRDETLSAPGADGTFEERVTVDTEVPSFVRLELRDTDGEPLAFSNPLHFVREPPRAGIAAERVAATIADLRIERAEEFALHGLWLDRGGRRLRITGRENADRGSLVVNTGARGAPAQISGVEAWSWENGLLSLAGFDGETSVIEIAWVAVADAPGAVHLLALGSGRPRPGGGADATFSLPRRMPVRIAVFAVDGRRVRLLVDDVLEPGEHTAAWDGRDARGDLVTSGVYFLRLETGGERLTSRAVVLR
jgi:hypothetical protein